MTAETNSTSAANNTKEKKVPPAYSSAKLKHFLQINIDEGKDAPGQRISVAIIQLFEAALIWEIKGANPDKKTAAIMGVLPFVGSHTAAAASVFADFFNEIKLYNQTREDNDTVPYIKRLRALHPNSEMRIASEHAMSGYMAAVLLAINFEPNLRSRAVKSPAVISEIGSRFQKAGYEAMPLFILDLFQRLYKEFH